MRRQITKIILSLPLITNAAVNMKDASFQRSFIDGGFLTRTYSSRTLYNGLFGFGWCSSIESRLAKKDDKWIIYDCEKESADKLKKVGLQYVRSSQDFEQVFDHKGRLIQMTAHQFELKLSYHDDHPTRIGFNGKTWHLQYREDGKIKSLSGANSYYMYDYSGQNLILVQKNNRPVQKFSYDELHNVTEIFGLGKEVITYDKDRDWVVELRRTDGCLEKYDYERSDSIQGPKEIAKAEIQCGKKSSFLVYEFFYQKNQNETLLARVRTIAGTEVTELKLKGDL